MAQHFGKQHKDVLKAIKNLECSVSFSRLNFQPSTYTDDRGKEYPISHMTRDGCLYLILGFTGKEAAQIKERYIDAFNCMEQELRRQHGMIQRVTTWLETEFAKT